MKKYEVTNAGGNIIGYFNTFNQAIDYINKNLDEVTKIIDRSYGYKIETTRKLYGGNEFKFDYFVREVA